MKKSVLSRARIEAEQASTALTVVEPPVSPAVAKLVDQAIRLNHSVALSLAGGVLSSSLCGKTLTDLKKLVPHGRWLPFVKEVLEPRGLRERTVQQHMAVWQCAKRKALKSANFADLLQLAERPSDDLSKAEQKALCDRTQHLCDAETASSLLAEYGVTGGKPKRRGGAHHVKCPHCKGNLKSGNEQVCPHCTKETGFPPPAENAQQQDAIDIWTPIMIRLHDDGLQEKTWAFLPDAMQRELKGLVVDLNKLLPKK